MLMSGFYQTGRKKERGLSLMAKKRGITALRFVL
jgi:hypothetical protein